MIMYSKNLPIPPKFDYPYQQQQRYSGSFVTSEDAQKPAKLADRTLSELEKTFEKLEAAKR
jgi:hypothetical protein